MVGVVALTAAAAAAAVVVVVVVVDNSNALVPRAWVGRKVLKLNEQLQFVFHLAEVFKLSIYYLNFK